MSRLRRTQLLLAQEDLAVVRRRLIEELQEAKAYFIQIPPQVAEERGAAPQAYEQDLVEDLGVGVA